jgi:hypothetical protein
VVLQPGSPIRAGGGAVAAAAESCTTIAIAISATAAAGNTTAAEASAIMDNLYTACSYYTYSYYVVFLRRQQDMRGW